MAKARPRMVLSGSIASLLLMPALALGAVAPAPSRAVAAEPVTLDAEQVFWRQPEQVSRAAGALAPGQAGHVDVFFVGFAGDDSQEIFAREVRIAAAAIAERLDPPGRSVLLLNNRVANAGGSPIASLGTLELALEELAPLMDPAEDVLFLYLASHGLPSNELYVANGDLPLEQVSPSRLRALLDRHGFKRRIIVVSACFSGDFARELADDSTVVLTAARSDRPSFGCRDSRGMTYFGEALWEYAVPRAATLEQAFALARTRVDQMEREASLTPSEPQMRVGAGARDWLAGMRLLPLGRAPDAVAGRGSGEPLAGVLESKRPGGVPARAPGASSWIGPITD